MGVDTGREGGSTWGWWTARVAKRIWDRVDSSFDCPASESGCKTPIGIEAVNGSPAFSAAACRTQGPAG